MNRKRKTACLGYGWGCSSCDTVAFCKMAPLLFRCKYAVLRALDRLRELLVQWLSK